MGSFKVYFKHRLEEKGINYETILHNIASIPRGVNSHLRLFLFQWLLNGLATQRRVRHFIEIDNVNPCYLCGSGSDTLEHLSCCEVTCAFADMCTSTATDLNYMCPWTPQKAGFRCRLDPQEIHNILFLSNAIWKARCLIAMGHSFRARNDLLRFLKQSAETCFTLYRDSRVRVVVPPPVLDPSVVLYRSDGAARGQGSDDIHACGFGCKCYGSDTVDDAWITSPLPDHFSNNEAEYEGVRCVLQRILRTRPVECIARMDSLLVCKQLRGEWQCKADHLKNYFDQCYGLLQRIRLTGIQIDLQHIYREFNKDADHLANLGADGQSSHRNWY